MKYRQTVFALLVTMLFSLFTTVYAQEPVMQFYSKTITEELEKANPDGAREIEEEIKEQIQAIMEINGIPETPALRSFTLANTQSVKTAAAGSEKAAKVLEQFGSAGDVMMRKIHVSTEDLFASRFLEYSWKVPVIETEDAYLFSVVTIHPSGDTVVSSGIAPKKEMSDVSYLFHKDLVADILENSGLHIDYDTILPVTIPMLSTDIILFSADELRYAISFSARPDLLGMENGTVCPYAETEAKIKEVIEEMSSEGKSSANPTGGGVRQRARSENTSDKIKFSSYLFPFSAAAVVVCAAWFWVDHKRRAG